MNEKIRDLEWMAKKELFVLGLKSSGLVLVTTPVLVMIGVGMQIMDRTFFDVVGVMNVLFIWITYNLPRTKKILEKYKKLMLEEINRGKRED